MTDEHSSPKQQRIERLQHLKQQEKQNNEHKIRQALLKIEEERGVINVMQVARRAGVSRDTVYASQHWPEIQQLRSKTKSAERSSVRATQTEDSLRRRLRDSLDEVQRLREENQKLRDEIRLVLLQRQILLKP